MAFPLGTLVVNFGATAMVVEHFTAADGQPCEQSGWPILREMTSDRRHFRRSGKWLADPAKCVVVKAAGE